MYPEFEITRTDVVPGIPLKLGHLVYGSWNEAHEYCQSKDLYLSTLTTTIRAQLKYAINLQFREYGWNFSDAYIFAGLHRSNEVSRILFLSFIFLFFTGP